MRNLYIAHPNEVDWGSAGLGDALMTDAEFYAGIHYYFCRGLIRANKKMWKRKDKARG
jgi:hypothetical protein